VVSGRFEFEVEGEKRICEAGEIVCIPSNQWHYGKAITDCVLMDVFTPVREEYR
jgi:quercetin dioxygenase-like cupin family protein